jgi:hypothetical protein
MTRISEVDRLFIPLRVFASWRSSLRPLRESRGSLRQLTAPRPSGHQFGADFVEPLRVNIELHIGQAQVGGTCALESQ